MKILLNHLKEWLITGASSVEIAEALTDIGLEVEAVIDQAQGLEAFEIVEIIATQNHPNADKLKVCQVQTKDSVLQIVCGAPNARMGLKTVLAKVGVEIPSGKFKIKAAQIRGVESCGMLCSYDELNLPSGNDGIIELGSDALVGELFINYNNLNDSTLELNITPNRGDALSIYGIARDLAAKNIGSLKPLVMPKVNSSFKSNFEIINKVSGDCPIFCAIEIQNVQNSESPAWLKAALAKVGTKSISAIVDIVNYVTLTYGQPFHAYDRDKLDQYLAIDFAKANTIFAGLDGKEYELMSTDIIVQDASKTQCIAGIMGALNSSCSSGTKNVIIEAAVFNAESIANTGRRLKILTDARYRFERNIDQNFTPTGLELATSMILELCGGQASEMITSQNRPHLVKIIEFDCALVEKMSGMFVPKEQIINILDKLGCKIDNAQAAQTLKVTIPSWRHDLSIPQDLVEEILRIEGYNNIPEIALSKITSVSLYAAGEKLQSHLKRILSGSGYDELVTWSFMHSQDASLFGVINPDLIITNPISNKLDYMRGSLMPNLLSACRSNLERSHENLMFYELGPVFQGLQPEDESNVLSGIRCGFKEEKSIHTSSKKVDVFDIKADLETLLSYLNINLDNLKLAPAPDYYHPSKSTNLVLGKTVLASYGQIHPKILKHFDIDEEIIGFELYLNNLPPFKARRGLREEFKFSNYPKVSRDFAFTMNRNQEVGNILSFTQNINLKLIKSVNLFDIYVGENIDSDLKSIAFNCVFQADDRTLTNVEITSLYNEIIQKLSEKYNIKLRE